MVVIHIDDPHWRPETTASVEIQDGASAPYRELRKLLKLNLGDRCSYSEPMYLLNSNPRIHIKIRFASPENKLAFNLAHATVKRTDYSWMNSF